MENSEIASYIIGGFIGAIFSLVLAVIFQDFLNNIRKILLKRIKYIFRKNKDFKIPYLFTFGRMETSVVVIECDIEDGLIPENIHCSFDPYELDFPVEIKRIIKNIEKRELSKNIHGVTDWWNGETYSLSHYSRSRNLPDEAIVLNLVFKKSDWFTHLATSWSLDTESVFSEKEGKKVTLRERYFTDYDWSNPNIQPHPYFSNAVGVAVCLITDDNYLIFVKRSEDVVASLGFNIAINETIQWKFDKATTGNEPDLYRATIRGCREELGFDLDISEIKFSALAVETTNSLWAMLGYAKTKFNLDEVLNFRRTNAKDKFEALNLYKVDNKINSILEFVHNHQPWLQGALPCIYFYLVAEYGKNKVDDAIRYYGI